MANADTSSCTIVGAGICGLLAARELRGAGWSVTVVDKGRGVGGRMATRRLDVPGAGEARCDHGAQFFTVRDDTFRDLVDAWQQVGAVAEWTRGFPRANGDGGNDGHPRYRGARGMTSIPKHLARGLDVRTGTRVVAAKPVGGAWEVGCEDGETLRSATLLLTAPVPQSLALIEGVEITDPAAEVLRGIAYDPCIALMAAFDGPTGVPEPGGVQIQDEPLDWIGDNGQKGISDVPAITVHAGPRWSADHFEAEEGEVVASLLGFVEDALGPPPSRVVATSIARWRYSWVTSGHEERCLVASEAPALVFAGDAFGGAKVEGAALGGLAAARALLEGR